MNLQNSNSIRIAIITNSHRADDTRVFDKIACSLAQKYKVILIHNQDNNFEYPNIDFISLRKSRNSAFILKSILLLKKTKPSVVICVEPVTLSIAFFLKLLNIKAKFIYDCHEFYAEAFADKFKLFKQLAYLSYQKIEHFLVRFTDSILTVNDLLDQEFVFHNNRYIISNYPRLKEIPLSEKEWDLLYIGGLSLNRGILVLINSVKMLKDQGTPIKALLIGKFLYLNDQKIILNFIKDLHLEDQITLRDFVPYSEIGHYISKAKIGVSLLNPDCSRYQKAIPLKLIEYMQYSLPVICNNFPIVKNIVDLNKCGYCINYKLKELSSAIINILENEKLYLEFSSNASKIVNSTYNWENEQKKLYECVEGLLNG